MRRMIRGFRKSAVQFPAGKGLVRVLTALKGLGFVPEKRAISDLVASLPLA